MDPSIQQQRDQMMASQQQQHSSPYQQQSDSTAAQDVLAEARKNLQVLIDSGLSKDLLHQWVDESQAQSLGLLSISSHQQQQQQTGLMSPPTIAPPPPPQCPPPPIPTMSQQQSPQTTQGQQSQPVTPTSNAPPTPNKTDIKREVLTEDVVVSNQWPRPPPLNMSLSSPTSTPTSQSQSQQGLMAARGGMGMGAEDEPSQAMFLPPSASFNHRPRISVSSTSSGSSGHASIWSTNSAQSSVSWASSASARSQLPLPPTPPVGHGPLSTPPLSHSASSASKTNIYWCTSCETSFKRKYDWKRHEDEFHERWRKYPCPEPGCNRSFWGSNSFNQHHKQCHGCKTCPHAEKVVKFLRKRKYWACGFCSALHPARERHVEHVARHFESGLTKSDWMHSRVVYGLLHQPLIHEAWDALVASKQAEYNGRRPQFSWHPSKTGRAQGFLENENPGQLQDLLEFFSGDEGEAQWIVSVAYDLADIVLTSAPAMASPPQYVSAQAQGGFDPRLSFMTLPTQAALMASPEQQTFGAQQPFRSTILVPSQGFPAPRPSPDSTSHSPLTTASSHSPLMPAHSPLDKRELPPPPPLQALTESQVPEATMMDFEYSPGAPPVVFENWETLMEASQAQAQQSVSATSQAPPDWGMVQFYGDPRVTS